MSDHRSFSLHHAENYIIAMLRVCGESKKCYFFSVCFSVGGGGGGGGGGAAVTASLALFWISGDDGYGVRMVSGDNVASLDYETCIHIHHTTYMNNTTHNHECLLYSVYNISD